MKFLQKFPARFISIEFDEKTKFCGIHEDFYYFYCLHRSINFIGRNPFFRTEELNLIRSKGCKTFGIAFFLKSKDIKSS